VYGGSLLGPIQPVELPLTVGWVSEFPLVQRPKPQLSSNRWASLPIGYLISARRGGKKKINSAAALFRGGRRFSYLRGGGGDGWRVKIFR